MTLAKWSKARYVLPVWKLGKAALPLILLPLLGGCAALAPHGSQASPSPSAQSTPAKQASPSPTVAPTPTINPIPNINGTIWRLGAVDFHTPHWMASTAAYYGMELWGAPAASVELASSSTDVMIIQEVGPGQSTSPTHLTSLLSTALGGIFGTISNGPVAGRVHGDVTQTYSVQYTNPTGEQENGLVIYWFSDIGDVALSCDWVSTETGVAMQDACRATLASLGVATTAPYVSTAKQNPAIQAATAFAIAMFSFNWRDPTADQSAALKFCTPKAAALLAGMYKKEAATFAYAKKVELIAKFAVAKATLKTTTANSATVVISGTVTGSAETTPGSVSTDKALSPSSDSATLDMVRMNGKWLVSNLSVSSGSGSIG